MIDAALPWDAICRGFDQERQSMPELKPDHGAVPKPRQFVKQIADRTLQLELICAGDLRPVNLAAQSRDPHHLHIAIENWLPGTNRQILDTAELVLVHQLHQEACSRAKVLSPQGWRLQP